MDPAAVNGAPTPGPVPVTPTAGNPSGHPGDMTTSRANTLALLKDQVDAIRTQLHSKGAEVERKMQASAAVTAIPVGGYVPGDAERSVHDGAAASGNTVHLQRQVELQERQLAMFREQFERQNQTLQQLVAAQQQQQQQQQHLPPATTPTATAGRNAAAPSPVPPVPQTPPAAVPAAAPFDPGLVLARPLDDLLLQCPVFRSNFDACDATRRLEIRSGWSPETAWLHPLIMECYNQDNFAPIGLPRLGGGAAAPTADPHVADAEAAPPRGLSAGSAPPQDPVAWQSMTSIDVDVPAAGAGFNGGVPVSVVQPPSTPAAAPPPAAAAPGAASMIERNIAEEIVRQAAGVSAGAHVFNQPSPSHGTGTAGGVHTLPVALHAHAHDPAAIANLSGISGFLDTSVASMLQQQHAAAAAAAAGSAFSAPPAAPGGLGHPNAAHVELELLRAQVERLSHEKIELTSAVDGLHEVVAEMKGKMDEQDRAVHDLMKRLEAEQRAGRERAEDAARHSEELTRIIEDKTRHIVEVEAALRRKEGEMREKDRHLTVQSVEIAKLRSQAGRAPTPSFAPAPPPTELANQSPFAQYAGAALGASAVAAPSPQAPVLPPPGMDPAAVAAMAYANTADPYAAPKSYGSRLQELLQKRRAVSPEESPRRHAPSAASAYTPVLNMESMRSVTENLH